MPEKSTDKELEQSARNLEKKAAEHRLTKEALKKSEEFSSGLLENSPTPILVVNQDTSIRYVNPMLENLTGYSSAEIIGRKAPFPWWPDTKLWSGNIDGRVDVFEGVKGLERIFRKKNGDYFWVEITNTPIIRNNKFQYALTTWVDITERKHVEEALQKAYSEMENKVRERTAELAESNRLLKIEIKGHKQSKEELELKTNNLEEINTALRVLLDKRDEDKTRVEEGVMSNIEELVEPYLEKIKRTALDDRQKSYISVLESNLKDIASQFSSRLSFKFLKLTPTEIQVANLVKQGRSTKEIAELMSLSRTTIATHRRNIRKKLGINDKKSNLRTYLLSAV
ncbi:MAG: PAS domain S-box protein [Deltaproteobacteria bacterium]|nr:PAS domain S-box protein [Deltaproteobacteria bacterium]